MQIMKRIVLKYTETIPEISYILFVREIFIMAEGG